MKTWIAIVAVAAQVICLSGGAWAQAFTRIVSPVQDQCVPGPDVVVKFEAGGMTLGPTALNLHFKLDEEPFQVQYDGNHAHVFKNVAPGTHTVRVYAANAMHEAIPGTQSTVSFSVSYPDKANYVMPGHPTLTYNLPQGEYVGIDAADVTVDFLLENAQLGPGGYQVAYYVDGRRFLVQDHVAPRHVKNLNPGFHRVRIELQDRFGDIVPGPFNSTERVILVSPDSVAKSPSPLHDGYDGLPRLDSIKGSMTMGQHWSATEPVRPLTAAEIERQEALTVLRADGERVGLRDGLAVNLQEELATSGGPAEVDQAATVRQSNMTGEIESQFRVRQGEEVEADSVDLDSVDTTNIRRGSIVVNEPDEIGDVDSGAVLEPRERNVYLEDDDAPAAIDVPVGTDEVNPDGPVSSRIMPSTSDAVVVTTPTTRRRADGTTTSLRPPTTPTLRLTDRPGLRQAETITTRTVRADDRTATEARTNLSDSASTSTQARARLNDDTSTAARRAARTDRENRAVGPIREGRGNRSGAGREDSVDPAPTLD